MNDIVKTYQERFRRNRHNFRRYAALLLALAMITTLFVNWQLHGVGISMTADYQCGEIEHTHTADCYEKVLICPYTEGEPEDGTVVSEPVAEEPAADTGIAVYNAEPEYIFVPHEHTDDCYTEVKTLTCSEEEHIHDDDCFDPEDGSLICDKFEHTHDEDCYTTERELTCGLEEGELVEELNPDYTPVATFEAPVAQTPVVVEPVAETPVHHHTDACYEEVLVCPLPEHQHTVNCLSDQTADIEDEGEWLAATDTTLGSSWAENLLAVAQSQLGYEQSEKNFKLETDEYNDDVVRHYTRYGQWYGNPYGEWDMMFLSYCLHYAEIPQSVVPQTAGVLALRSAMNNNGTALLQDVDSRTVAVQDADSADAGTTIAPGDIVIYSKNKMETIVWEQSEPTTDPSDSGIALYSSGFVPSGPVVADDDFVAPTDPTPVYTTKTTTVETAGIVESVDSKRGTVTVISGDVEGKVDTLELSLAQVQSVVSMTRAQAALDKDSLATVVLDESYVTKTTITVNNNTTVIKENGIFKDVQFDLFDGDKISLTYNYTLPSGVLNDTNRTLTYKLPGGILPDKEKSEPIKQGNAVVGTYTVHPDGTITLQFNDTFNAAESFDGFFTLDGVIDRSKADDSDKIKFPGDHVDITVKDRTDLEISKNGKITGRTADGKYIVYYKVTLSSGYGSGKDIELKDYLKVNGTKFEVGSSPYSDIKLTDKKGQKIDIKVDNIVGTDGNPGIWVKTANDELLPALSAGEKYILEYYVTVDNKNNNGENLYNTAWANDTPKDKSVWFGSEFSKSGSYNSTTKEITWTITIDNNNGGNLNGYTVGDTMNDSGATIIGDVIITDANGNQFDKISDAVGKTKFEYTFTKDAKSSKYTITYTTNATSGTTVTNHASLTYNGDTKHEVSKNVKAEERKKDTSKTKATNGLEPVSGSSTLYKAYWNINVVAPEKWGGGFNVSDKIISPSGADGSHYALASELEAEILSDAHLTYDTADGKTYTYTQMKNLYGVGVSIRYYSDDNCKNKLSAPIASDQHVRSFIVCFTESKKPDIPEITAIHIDNYHTYVDTDGLKAGKKYQFQNKADNDSESYYWYTTDLEPKITKMVATKAPSKDTDKGSYKDQDITITYDESGTYIYYQLKLYFGDIKQWVDTYNKGDPTITVKDTLNKYLKLQDDSVRAVFKYNWDAMTTGENGYNINDHLEWEVDKDTNVVTFTISDLDKIGYYGGNESTRYEAIYLRYAVKVEDPSWTITPDQDIQIYGNHAEWSGKHAYRDTNVESNVQIVDKIGDYDEATNRVHYTVIINPTAKMIGTEQYITLTDTLTVQGDSNSNYATLDADSLNLYPYSATATDHKGSDTPIPKTSYTLKYQTDVDSNNYNTYTMTLRILNGHAYVLEYDYINSGNTKVNFHNKAVLEGDISATKDANVKHVDLSAGVTQNILTIHKVDSDNTSLSLPGATFQLDYYDSSLKTWVNAKSKTGVSTIKTTGSDGQIQFFFSKEDIASLPIKTLYRLTEISSPSGYADNSEWTYYFIWAQDQWNMNKDNLISTAIGGYKGDGSPIWDLYDQIHLYAAGASYDLQVTNERNELIVEKIWLDKNGNVIRGQSAPEVEITVDLYSYTTDKADAEVVQTITLNNGNNWQETVSNLDAGKYYFIKEASTAGSYDVTYSENNKFGIKVGGVLTVTNQEKEDAGYELPSTGGAGTTPFTAVGGTMMLAALVYGVRRKRRRKGGAAD